MINFQFKGIEVTNIIEVNLTDKIWYSFIIIAELLFCGKTLEIMYSILWFGFRTAWRTAKWISISNNYTNTKLVLLQYCDWIITGGPDFSHMPSGRCSKLPTLNAGHCHTPPFWHLTHRVDFKRLFALTEGLEAFSKTFSWTGANVFPHCPSASVRWLWDSSFNEFISKYAFFKNLFTPFFPCKSNCNKLI